MQYTYANRYTQSFSSLDLIRVRLGMTRTEFCRELHITSYHSWRRWRLSGRVPSHYVFCARMLLRIAELERRLAKKPPPQRSREASGWTRWPFAQMARGEIFYTHVDLRRRAAHAMHNVSNRNGWAFKQLTLSRRGRKIVQFKRVS